MGTALLKYKYSSTYNMMKLSGILLYNSKSILSVNKEDELLFWMKATESLTLRTVVRYSLYTNLFLAYVYMLKKVVTNVSFRKIVNAYTGVSPWLLI